MAGSGLGYCGRLAVDQISVRHICQPERYPNYSLPEAPMPIATGPTKDENTFTPVGDFRNLLSLGKLVLVTEDAR